MADGDLGVVGAGHVALAAGLVREQGAARVAAAGA
jgi:hypothetical protein